MLIETATTYPITFISNHTEFPSMKRQYTLTCEQDSIDISEGYCPKYAIWWDEESNRMYWPKWWKIRHRPEYLLYKKRVIRERILAISFHKIPYVSLSRSASDSVVSYYNNRDIMEQEESIKSVRFEIFNDVIPIPNIPVVYDDIFTSWDLITSKMQNKKQKWKWDFSWDWDWVWEVEEGL
jgi:hypothetical protein